MALLATARAQVGRYPTVVLCDDEATTARRDNQGRFVVVLGWSELVTGFALELLDWAGRLTIITQGRRCEGDERDRQVLADHGVELVEDDAVELVGQPGRLQTVRVRSGASIDADLVFFSIAHHAEVHLAEQLGCEAHGRRLPAC